MSAKRAEPPAEASAPRAATRPEPSFERRILAMLLTFFGVAALDLLVVSPMTGHLRVWFPVWLDPHWDAHPDGLVTYSQSYIAGICLIPVLLQAVDGHLLRARGRAWRALWWGLGLAVLAFIAWWKGGLMIRYGKGLEAVGWVLATALVWALVSLAQRLPQRAAGLTRTRLLGGLLRGLAAFFLVMAVLDPAIQVGLHGLAWSSGLIIEVAFFIPAGATCLGLSRRFRSERAA